MKKMGILLVLGVGMFLGNVINAQDRERYQKVLDQLEQCAKQFDTETNQFYLDRLQRVQLKSNLSEDQIKSLSQLLDERLAAIQAGIYNNNPDKLKENIAFIITYNYKLNY